MSLLTEVKMKTENSVINPETEAVIKKIISKIPHTLHGPDRVSFLIEVLPSISFGEKELLIGCFNSFLSEMVKERLLILKLADMAAMILYGLEFTARKILSKNYHG